MHHDAIVRSAHECRIERTLDVSGTVSGHDLLGECRTAGALCATCLLRCQGEFVPQGNHCHQMFYFRYLIVIYLSKIKINVIFS